MGSVLSLNDGQYCHLSHTCIKGDNQYASIAAASILAKVQRDQYIEDLCSKYPLLDEYYGLSKNKGYGTKQHMEGLKKYGITALSHHLVHVKINQKLIYR